MNKHYYDTNPIKVQADCNFDSPYLQAYMQASNEQTPLMYPTPTIKCPSAPAVPFSPAQEKQGIGEVPFLPPMDGAPETISPVSESLPAKQGCFVRHKAIIFFAALFSIAAVALTIYFYGLGGKLFSHVYPNYVKSGAITITDTTIPVSASIISGALVFSKPLAQNELGVILSMMGSTVFALATFITAIVALGSRNWKPVLVFAILSFALFVLSAALDYFAFDNNSQNDFLHMISIKKDNKYYWDFYAVFAAQLASLVLSFFCYIKKKKLIEQL